MPSYIDPEGFEPGQLQRKGFGLKDQIRDDLTRDYYSKIVEQIIASDYEHHDKGISFHLAKSFGFCYGVDRAVDMAYETHKRFPDRKIYLTAEIIHNPRVSENLEKMGVEFLTDYQKVQREDVVLLPAFGATMGQIERLREKGCLLVDTTCGSVLSVWKRVEGYSEDGFTSVIHGKYYHEETQATSSRVLGYPKGTYLVVLNMDETRYVCDYIRHGGDREAFLKKFSKGVSAGFNPDEDLKKVGVANQTTMLMSESLAIAAEIKKAMIDRYGQPHVDAHFRNFDTICSATEDRQVAMLELTKKPLDIMMVVGGFNSSNTANLSAIASKAATAYHISDVSDLISNSQIRHKPAGKFDPIVTDNWLPAGPLQIGITSGASTPNQVLGGVIERILSFR